MPISYVSGGFVNNQAGGQGIVTAPSGLQKGDVMLATIVVNGSSAVGTTGFTPAAFEAIGGDSFTFAVKNAESNEPASYTFGAVDGTFCVVVLDAYRGVGQLETRFPASVQGTSANILFADITTKTANAWHYASFFSNQAGTFQVPANYTQRTVGWTASNSGGFDRIITTPSLITGVMCTGGGAAGWVSFSASLGQASGSLLGAGTM